MKVKMFREKISFAKLFYVFFQNISIRQTILKNTIWLFLAQVITKFFTFSLFVCVAREFGPSNYGIFAFALSFVVLLGVLSDLGISSIATREFSREKKSKEEFVGLLSLKFILMLITLGVTFVACIFFFDQSEIQKIVLILAIYVIINRLSDLFYAYLEACHRMEYEAVAKILQAVFLVSIGFFVVFYFPSIQNLSLGYLVSALLFLFFLLLFFHLKIYHLSFKWDVLLWKKYLSMSWPLAFVGLFAVIYVRIDSVMMGFFGQVTETGWYNAVYRIIQFTAAPAALISKSFFPFLSVAFKDSSKRFKKIISYHIEAMMVLAVPLVVGGVVLAPKIIDFLYGSEYSPSILAFQILILASGFIFLLTPFNRALIAANHQRKIFWVEFIGAIVNIVLNFILIPIYSLYGAAVATVITYFMMFVLFVLLSVKFVKVEIMTSRFQQTLISVILAVFLMYIVVSKLLFYSLSVLWLVVIGVIVYTLCLYVIKKGIKKLFKGGFDNILILN